MVKRIQILLSEEAWANVKSITEQANLGFEAGHITWSDTINYLVEHGKADIEELQSRHLNLKKSLRSLAKQKEVDLDGLIKQLQKMKTQQSKRKQKTSSDGEGL